ncbi:MAG: terminase family protein [Phycisphaerae bacterium]|nr:terminase family protein [Phycisphaerae bacterium]
MPLLPYQRSLVACPARFTWANWSRQVGKSFAFSLRRVVRGLMRGRSQLLLSASERQSRELMAKVRQHCAALRVATGALAEASGVNGKGLEVVLARGVRVLGLPANPETVRGFSGDVFLDEFAMHRDDRAIWAAIFPTILRGEGELDVASTPKGMSNLFYELGRHERFQRSTVTIHDAVRDGLRVDVEGLRSAMVDDELFRQEFCCEFLDEATAWLTYEQISRCEDPSLSRDLRLGDLRGEGASLAVGVDVGRRRDLTVIWVVQPRDGGLVTRGLLELRGMPFREQEGHLREILSLPTVRRCCVDATGLGMQLAESAVEAFGEDRVEPVSFTAQVKTALAGRLRVLVEGAEIRIPAEPDIRNDWHSVRRTMSPGGQIRFEADRDGAGHADRFWAAALAVRAADRMVGPMEYLSTGRLTFARTGVW